MDRLLRPEKLETLPEDPDAAKVFEYWFKTFENFLSAVTNVTDNEGAVNRLARPMNWWSPYCFSFPDSFSQRTSIFGCRKRSGGNHRRCTKMQSFFIF